ncbi:YIP1 family protein [Paenibacillus tarimensis]
MVNSRGRWKWIAFLCFCLVAPMLMPSGASAEVPYFTFSRDSYGYFVFTQSPYHPVKYAGHDIYIADPDKPGERVHSPMNNPQDLFIAANDHMYIADTGNHRIVHLDAEGKFIRSLEFPDDPLRSPEGVFVDEAGFIYIADTGNQRIVVAGDDGEMVSAFGKPDSSYLPASFKFDPVKLVVDARGFMYIVSRGAYQGLVLMTPQGGFQGFFAANRTDAGIFDRIKLMIYSEEQLKRQARLLPRVPKSVEIDDTGFIYTTTFDVDITGIEQIKKFNVRGENLLKDIKFSFFSVFNDVLYPSQFVDAAVDSNGNMIAIDQGNNNVAIYSPRGDVLFSWTGQLIYGQRQLGLIQTPSSVAVNSKNDLFILDSSQNNIQQFKRSNFGELVFEAMSLMDQGRYQESVEIFQEVIRLNAHFSPAYKGLGLAAYHRGEYEEALKYFKHAGDKQGYSDTYWQIRLQWFQNNFSLAANLFLIIGAVWVTGRMVAKRSNVRIPWRVYKRKYKLVEQLKHALTILRHPLEGFSDLRYDKKGSYISGLILLLAAISSLLIKTFYIHFPFSGDTPLQYIRSSTLLFQYSGVWLSWVVCNYLISSIYRGEGRFSDVFIGSAYALTPVILLAVPVTVLSQTMTLSESSIYNFFNGAMIIWVCLLLFWMVQALQNYSVAETIINILLTLFTMVILWVLIFIVAGLTIELYSFLYSIYQEVTMR